MSEKKQQQSFKIGQVVYVLSDKAEAIVPAIVVEEMVVKKLDGSSVSWKVAVGPPDKKKIVASHELTGDVYTSLDEIREVMTKRLETFVNNLLDVARQRTETWYGKQVPSQEQVETTNGKIDPASLIDSIEGRERAQQFITAPGQEVHPGVPQQQQQQQSFKIKAPVNQGPLQPQVFVDPTNPQSVLRAKLKALAEPEDEELNMDNVDEFVVTSDGRKIPVKFNNNQ